MSIRLVRKMRSVFWPAAAVLMFVQCSPLRTAPGPVQTMKLSELSAEPGKYEKLIDEIEHGNHFILRVGPGEALPLRAAMTLPFVRLEAGNNKLVFSREVYIYLAKGVLRLSPDAQQWADIQDTDAMKEIFGVDTFNLLLGFGANQADGAFFSFSLGSE